MSTICRICLVTEGSGYFININEELSTKLTILQGIISCSSIQSFEEDILPKTICEGCLHKLRLFNEFRELIIKSDQVLRSSLYSQNKCENKPNISEYQHQETVISSEDHNSCVDIQHEPYKTTRNKINLFECRDCNKIFGTSDIYKEHMKNNCKGKKFACEFCPKRFSRSYVLIYHRRIHTDERPYTCDVCSKRFRFPSNFYVHKKIHTNHRKYKCDQCSETFPQLESLKIHVRRLHTGERPYLCEKCSSTFRSNSSLLTHQIDVHGKKQPCPICHKFYSIRILKQHVQMHKDHEVNLKKFPCEHCGKRFTSLSSKKKHLLIHSGEKPFGCKLCEKTFNQHSTLKTHMRVHSDCMAYGCDHCPKAFKYKHHLKMHVANHHKVVPK